MSNEQIQQKIAKAMFAEVKAAIKDGKTAVKVNPHNNMWERTYKGETKSVYKDGKTEIEFSPLTDAYSRESFWRGVFNEFRKLIDGKFKGFEIMPKFATVYGSGWSSAEYEIFQSVTIIRPCAEFKKLNKKLESLGLKPIDPTEWRFDRVFGKRSSYEVSETQYKCAYSKPCAAALEYLKGFKKATVEIKRIENLEDREYGERHETEWSGSIDYWLAITTSKGTKTF